MTSQWGGTLAGSECFGPRKIPKASENLLRIEAAGYGKLTSADSTWSQFKVAVTEPDGTLSYHTLDALGITEIDLLGGAIGDLQLHGRARSRWTFKMECAHD